MNKQSCPRCGLSHIKKNGHTRSGKQNYQCLSCQRQFVETTPILDAEMMELLKRLLLERLSLRGICRVLRISLTWLLRFIREFYLQLPDDLNVRPVSTIGQVQLMNLEAEADEMWSFVGKKENKQWVWIAIDVNTKQVIAFHVGDRSRDSARALWKLLPTAYQQSATFYTDNWDAYRDVIPEHQHLVCDKGSGHTNIIERFNCTLRQRVSRLVRESLAFSKILVNHIGAIKYFICHYNSQVIRFS